MKFGKRYAASQRLGWDYIDYKVRGRAQVPLRPARAAHVALFLRAAIQSGRSLFRDYSLTARPCSQALKKVIKKLFGPGEDSAFASAEAEFEQELYHGITAVNSFFIEKERELLSLLPQHESSVKGGASESGTDAFFKEVSELYAYTILNYLAVSKIVKVRRTHASAPLAFTAHARAFGDHTTGHPPRACAPQKHDKHSQWPLRAAALDVLFSQAFYLSLEHSYLYSSCRAYLSEHPTPVWPIDADARTLSPTPIGKAATNLLRVAGGAETLEVPVHFECTLLPLLPAAAAAAAAATSCCSYHQQLLTISCRPPPPAAPAVPDLVTPPRAACLPPNLAPISPATRRLPCRRRLFPPHRLLRASSFRRGDQEDNRGTHRGPTGPCQWDRRRLRPTGAADSRGESRGDATCQEEPAGSTAC